LTDSKIPGENRNRNTFDGRLISRTKQGTNWNFPSKKENEEVDKERKFWDRFTVLCLETFWKLRISRGKKRCNHHLFVACNK
jgi:hypothetical protein